MKTLVTLSLAVITAVTLAASSSAAPAERGAMGQNIVQVASASPQFSTLVSLVKKAGLVGALSNPNARLTVFAPTNTAFAALKKSAPMTFDKVATTPALLKKVLTYHVLATRVDGAAATAAAKKGASVKTLEGEKITLALTGGKLVLDGSATVTKADIPASNGVVHVINAVLVPPSVSAAG